MLYGRSTGNRDESIQQSMPGAEDETLTTTLITLLEGIWLEFSMRPRT